ncbi:uncharacterized protein LOC120684997 [Panicum virgatum]|uniref:uncharacterized protein LOC120684997 n=1 Tax=Panicum virgatum TaxID=38727 RepID=UPI0019D63E5F|nr:uncharacterized protein LOC120684997 [Panicum virgatum]
MAPESPSPVDPAAAEAQRVQDAADAKQRAADQEKERLALAAAAAAAAKERVRAALKALELERRTAADLERKAADAHKLANPPIHHDGGADDDFHDAAAYEAAVIANLHAQAAGVQNIRTDAAHPTVPAWRRMDAVVLSWLFGAVTTELMETVRTRGGTARTAWLGIEAQFLGNREFRALQLDAKFRIFTQGDLSIGEYCSKMKSMADQLGDLGEVVHDRTLVLNVLRGLNERYAHMRIHFRRTNPFPCFRDVRNDLLLEELSVDAPASAPPTALLASTTKGASVGDSSRSPAAPSSGGSGGSGRGSSGAGGSANTGTGGSGGNRRRRRKGQGQAQGQAPWPSIYNPWTGQITMWPGTSAGQQQQRGPAAQQQQRGNGPQQATFHPALLAALQPQPALLQQQAQQQQLAQQQQFALQQFAPQQHHAVPGQQQHQTPWTPWSGSWDQQSLANSFSTMTLHPPASTDWVVDTGASTHMTPDSGYRCLDLSTNRILISRHVVFDEASFPLSGTPHPTNELDFLQSDHEVSVFPIGPRPSGVPDAPPAGLHDDGARVMPSVSTPHVPVLLPPQLQLRHL